MNVYPFIEAEQAGKHNTKRACELMEVSRSAYYQHARGRQSQRERVDQVLTEKITAVHEQSKGTYGAPRVHAELSDAGLRHSRKRVARLMRAAGIRQVSPPVAHDYDSRPGRHAAPGLDPTRLHHRPGRGRHPLVRRHHLHRHLGRLAVSVSYVESSGEMEDPIRAQATDPDPATIPRAEIPTVSVAPPSSSLLL